MKYITDKKIVFREIVKKDDPEKIKSLVKNTGFFTLEEIEIAEELVLEYLSKGVKSGYNFIFAEIDEKIIGYTCYGLIPCSKISFDLYWIVVDKEYQGIGIGKLLNAETEKRIKNMGGIQIIAETSSKRQYNSTRKFYASTGYKRIISIPDFYDKGDGKVIFLKRL